MVAIVCVAVACGKLVSKVKLPAILGWLIAGIDDIIGVVVFFTVISIIGGTSGASAASPLAIVGMVLLPFVIGIFTGVCAAFLMKRSRNNTMRLTLLVSFLCVSVLCGLLIDKYLFHSFSLNYLLIGLAFSTTAANIVPEKS